MTIRATNVVGGLLLAAVAFPALACELPKIPVIPARDQIGDQAPAVTAATSAYFEGMRAYADCIEAALAAAGGDAAPASLKGALIERSHAAVAEAQQVQKLYEERVAVGQTATPGSEVALRKYIEGIASGMPDYDAMTPEWARTAKQTLAFAQRAAAAAGAIQSVEFGGIDPDGRNVYVVHQANGITNARIGLDADGKINFAMLRPAPLPGEKRPTARIPPRH
ncbi:MAG TPA: hypothetical protein VGL98_16415 [Gammaproteobacteria bacterium]